MNTKQCRQCGEIKPIEQFRKYYGGRQGTYTLCRSCERINSRLKYLERKGSLMSDAEQEEVDKIYKLYDAQRACGLKPPKRTVGKHANATNDLDDMLEVYLRKAGMSENNETPAELQQWLTCKLQYKPSYYLDHIYEYLKDKYRPVLRIDQDSLLPVHDETHADTLAKILTRFYDYEETYYQED